MESSRPEQHQDWLRLVHERPRNKPFFLWLATYDAHRPFDAPITLHGHSPEAVLVPAGLIDNDATRNDLAEYYAMIHRADMDIGLVLRLLERQGVLQNTLVIVVGDNGRSFPWAKSYLYDAGLKTPLIVHWPEGLKANASAALVSSVDIAPTVLELLGLSPSNAMQGESFAGLLAGRQSAHRDAVFAERNWRGIYPADARSVRTADYLYIRNYDVIADNCLGSDSGNPSSQSLVHANAVWMDAPLTHRCFPALWPEEELYALSTDPDQQINRATDPALNGVLESMRQRLTDWQRDTGDYRSVRYSPLTEQWCQQHNQVGCH
jgi:arylsulfatase A-like enzyme